MIIDESSLLLSCNKQPDQKKKKKKNKNLQTNVHWYFKHLDLLPVTISHLCLFPCSGDLDISSPQSCYVN